MSGKFYLFLRFYSTSYKKGMALLTTTMIKKYTTPLPGNRGFTHVSLNTTLSDNFVGLNIGTGEFDRIQEETIDYDQRKKKPRNGLASARYNDNIFYEKSSYEIVALEMPGGKKDYEALQDILIKSLTEEKFLYSFLTGLKAGLDNLKRRFFKRKLEEEKGNAIENSKDADSRLKEFSAYKKSFVCSSYCSYVLSHFYPRLNNYLKKNGLMHELLSPNDLYDLLVLKGILGIKVIPVSSGCWNDYTKNVVRDMSKFSYLSNYWGFDKKRYKIVEQKRKEKALIDSLDENSIPTSFESKHSNIENRFSNMPKNKRDYRIVDLSNHYICSIESLPSGLKALIDVDEKTKTITSNAMELDAISRNRNLYDGESVYKAFETNAIINEKRKQGKLFGEFEHPDRRCDIERFLTVKEDRVCHRIHKWWREGSIMKIKSDFNPGPLGNVAWSWISSGSNPSFSVRIFTKNYAKKEKNGLKYTEKFGEMWPVTFDFVTIPGFYSAYAANPDQYDINDNFNSKSSTESFIRDYEAYRRKVIDADSKASESWNFEITNNSLGQLIRSQESFPILQEALNVDLSKANMFYTQEGLIVIEATKNSKVIVQARDFELNKVLFDASAAKRANKRLKEKIYQGFESLNENNKYSVEAFNIAEEELSAEEFVAKNPKVSLEDYKENHSEDVKKQIEFGLKSFVNSLESIISDEITTTTIARANVGTPMFANKQDFIKGVRKMLNPVASGESIQNLPSNRTIDLFEISAENLGCYTAFCKALPRALEKANEAIRQNFGSKTKLSILSSGNYTIESFQDGVFYNKKILAKVNLRVE